MVTLPVGLSSSKVLPFIVIENPSSVHPSYRYVPANGKGWKVRSTLIVESQPLLAPPGIITVPEGFDSLKVLPFILIEKPLPLQLEFVKVEVEALPPLFIVTVSDSPQSLSAITIIS